MLKEQAKLFSKLLMLFDFIVLVSALFVSTNLYLSTLKMPFRVTSNYEYFSYIFAAIIWIASLRYYGAYHSSRKVPYAVIIEQIFKAVFVAAMIFGMGLFTFNNNFFHYNYVILVFAATLASLMFERLMIVFFLRKMRKKGYNFRHVLIAGSGKRGRRFLKLIESQKEWGIKCLGFLDEAKKKGQEIDGVRVIGALEELESILDNKVVDEVVFCLPRNWINKLEEYIMVCERVGVKAYMALDFFNIDIAKTRLSELGGIPLLCMESTPSQVFTLLIKRCMDIIISSLLIIILAPVFLVAMLLIRISSPGSIFFGQERCGVNGRRFTMWKFRTMVNNAEALKSELAHLNEQAGPVFKIKNDPRLIPYGKILRKFSLDELPQLYNVLKGDMSIVGPRPPVPSEVKKYDRWQRRRLSLKPGLTCLWQVNGRNKVSFDNWVKLDLEYIDKWSLGLDLKIMLKTIPAVIKGTGA
jgi:exopolysaccharide biosynthesis polyprenyl glycosylphosphotransferase